MQTIEILLRTHHRPKCFSRCVDSILETVKDVPIRFIIHGIFDDEADLEYGKVRVEKVTLVKPNPLCSYPPNEYYRHAKTEKDAWILHLDDDDLMCGNWNVMVNNLGNPANMILWKVWLEHKQCAVPEIIGSFPMRKDTRGIGFLVHKTQWLPWPPKRAGDVAVMQILYRRLKHIWINDILTRTQGERGCCGKTGDY